MDSSLQLLQDKQKQETQDQSNNILSQMQAPQPMPDYTSLLARKKADPNVIEGNPPPEAVARYFGGKSQAPFVGNGTTGTFSPMSIDASSPIVKASLSKVGSQADNGYCQRFTEKMTTGKSGTYPSAIAAWNAQKNKASTDFSKIKPGDAIYFSPNASNQGYGHTGVYVGNGKFVSATYNGVQTNDITQWSKSTGQQPLGYIPS